MNWGQREICITSLLICAFLVVLGVVPRCAQGAGVWSDEIQQEIHPNGSYVTYEIQQRWDVTWHPCIELNQDGPQDIDQYIEAHHGWTELRVKVTVHYPDGRKTVYFIPITSNDRERKEN